MLDVEAATSEFKADIENWKFHGSLFEYRRMYYVNRLIRYIYTRKSLLTFLNRKCKFKDLTLIPQGNSKFERWIDGL